MTSHELARLLLTGPDLPVATHANNHTYNSEDHSDSHGKLKVDVYVSNYGTKSVCIGNQYKKDLEC